MTVEELEANKKRVAELEGQLGEKTTELAAASRERHRLQTVETELQASNKRLTDEMSRLKVAHASGMQKLMDARAEVEGSLQAERDEAMKQLEAGRKRHQDELQSAKGQAELALASLQKVDTTLASKFSHRCSFFL